MFGCILMLIMLMIIKMDKLNELIIKIYDNVYVLYLAIFGWISFMFFKVCAKIFNYIFRKAFSEKHLGDLFKNFAREVVQDFWDFVSPEVNRKINKIDIKITKLEKQVNEYRNRAHNIKGEYYTIKEAIKRNDEEFLSVIRKIYLKRGENDEG